METTVGLYQIKIYKKILTPNYGCVGATYKLTCSDTVFASLVIFFIHADKDIWGRLNLFIMMRLSRTRSIILVWIK